MQTLNGEKQALWKAWRRKNQSEWQTALECRAIGQHWSNIKAIIKARRKAGEQITVAQWAEANAPVTHRWLDEFSSFADRWEEFRAAWQWTQTLPYLPGEAARLARPIARSGRSLPKLRVPQWRRHSATRWSSRKCQSLRPPSASP